jgi:hypothetical protein
MEGHKPIPRPSPPYTGDEISKISVTIYIVHILGKLLVTVQKRELK